MKKGFVFSLLAVLALAGCQTKEPDYAPQQESKHFTATIEDNFNDGETRTFMDENGNVRWKRGDQVSIFAGSTVNEQYQVTDASDGKTSAAFNKVSGGGFVGGGEIDNNIAFYPYASTAEIAKSGSSYVISDVTLPATQYYAEASFGNGAFPMAAVTSSTTDMNLKFKNVIGGLKLQLKGTASIASISVAGNQNEILCGAAAVTVSNGSAPSVSLTDASAKTVTLDCGDGVQLDAETATPFVIALPPMTMEGGFTVVVTDTEGKQMEIKTTKTQTINRSNLLKMPAVNYVGVSTIDYNSEPFTITSTGNTSVAIKKWDPYSQYNIVLEYRKNSEEWASYTFYSVIDLADGESLQFRAGPDGNPTFRTLRDDTMDYCYFDISGTGSVVASGNLMSLLDRNLERDYLNPYEFQRLFYNCSSLVDASNLKLPATSLARACYLQMFWGCANLTAAPELPATYLAESCYNAMFGLCTSLTSAPELPATSLARSCYISMFTSCTSLTNAPTLPATTLEIECYSGMFGNCTSLTTAPVLPATTLASDCYSSMFSGCTNLTYISALPATSLAPRCCQYMFNECTSLTTAPALLATTLADDCYYSMFYGCENLTIAPELPATSLASGCYANMFQRCTSLTSAPELPATSLASGCYANMFQECTSLTIAPALPATTLASDCYARMFVNCTSLTTAPDLPAASLADGCYYTMFAQCTSLTTAPELPATDLVSHCYSYMFAKCSNLDYVKALFISSPSSNYTASWLEGVSTSGTFVKSKDATWNVTGSNGIPSGWTILTE